MLSFAPTWRPALLLTLPVLLLAAILAAGPAVAQTDRPNIVFLLADDMRADVMSHAGNTIIETPALDRLAADGVSFENSYVTTAICMVSRATFLTGQYKSGHGIDDFGIALSPEHFANTYPMQLRAAGYYTGFIGKWGLGGELPTSFDYFKGFPGQGFYYAPEDKDEKGPHLTEVMGNQAEEFIGNAPRDRPFLLSVSFKAPHVQDQDPRQFIPDHKLDDRYADAVVPPPVKGDPAYFEALPEFMHNTILRQRWERRFATEEAYQQSVKDYYRLVTGIDIVAGRIREQLASLGLADNTIIVFTSDHGMYLGEMGFAGKWLMHEESIRTPLIIVDPRLPDDRDGTSSAAMALNIDIAPTLLEMAGVAPVSEMQGRSLMPLVRGESPAWRSEWYYEHHFARDREIAIPAIEGVHTGGWKYMRYPDSEPLFEELYDLKNDPQERTNLAKDPAHAETLEHHRKRWNAWREAVKHTGEGWSEPTADGPLGG